MSDFRVFVHSRLHRGSLEFRILEFWNSHYIDYVDYTDYTDYIDYTDCIDYIDCINNVDYRDYRLCTL